MEFTLRQARNLESRLRNLEIDHQIIEIRAYDSAIAREDLEAGIDALEFEMETKLGLNNIRHYIKRMINEQNMECGVALLLNQRDELYAKRDILNTFGAHDSLDRQVSHIASSPKPTRMVNVYMEEMSEEVDTVLSDIDHQLNEISRELNDLNNSVTITIDGDDLELLQEENIL